MGARTFDHRHGSGSLVVAQDRRSEQVAAKGATDETVLFFERNAVTDLKLTIDQEGQESLRQTPRDYTRCTLIEDGTHTFKRVAVKLKGAAGSYRDFDDRPGLTLNVGKYKEEQRFHGMKKFT